jgi:hypothetical protein
MYDAKKIRFTFRCKDCKMIISSEFDDEDDIEDVRDDKLYLECPCGGKCSLLRD